MLKEAAIWLAATFGLPLARKRNPLTPCRSMLRTICTPGRCRRRSRASGGCLAVAGRGQHAARAQAAGAAGIKASSRARLRWRAATRRRRARSSGPADEPRSHGYAHHKVGELSPRSFGEDVLTTRLLLEDIGGVQVKGYRAPSFSIGIAEWWAFERLGEAGYALQLQPAPRSRTTTTACRRRPGILSGRLPGR